MSDVTAIALFAYNRPDLLARTLASLRENAIPTLYAFVDGPRSSADASSVRRVRALLRGIDWTDVTVIERQVNAGLGRSIVAGVTDVLRRHERVIVVEDDLICARGTFAWLDGALRHYADDPRVMSVSAWTHPRVTPPGIGETPFFCGRVATLYWGTWRRAWEGVANTDAQTVLAAIAARGGDPAAYGVDIPEMAAAERTRNIWGVRLIAHQLLAGGLCLQPARSLVRHIGYDARATNALAAAGWDAPAEAVAPTTRLWPEPIEAPEVAALWRTATDEDAAASAAPPPPREGIERVAASLGYRARRMAMVFEKARTQVSGVLTELADQAPRRFIATDPVREAWDAYVARTGGAAFALPLGDVAHEDDDIAALRAAIDALPPGGEALVAFPTVAAARIFDPRDTTPRSVRRWYARTAIGRVLTAAGVTGTFEAVSAPLPRAGSPVQGPEMPLLYAARVTRPADWKHA